MARIHILKGFSDLGGALWVLKYHPGLGTRSEIVDTILENGLIVSDRTRFEILQLLHEWGLANVEQGFRLTSDGEKFYSLWEMRQDIAIDVLHGLQYGWWTRHSSDQNLASWGYQRVCGYLWEYHALPKPQDLIADVYDNREDLEGAHGNVANAFSSKSVNGAYDWLLPLDPPVLKDVSETSTGRKNFRRASFTRRTRCSSALFLMGLSWVARETGIGYGELVEITDERRLDVCRFCLIEESSFDIMLNQVLTRFDFLSAQQIGRFFVVIQREPQITDF